LGYKRNKHGKRELLNIISEKYKDKIKIIYTGVTIPKTLESKEKKYNLEKFKIVVPANILKVKGHKYLIEACSILVKQGVKNFECIFYGEGSLRAKLENLIKKKRLSEYIKMPGAIPHEILIRMYQDKEIDAVVLPSVITNNGEHEGVPVSLMEAMAYSIPVISTNTGGIPELLSNGAGVMIEEKNPRQLATTMLKLIENKNLRKKIGKQGRKRIYKEFNIQRNIKKLLELFEYYS